MTIPRYVPPGRKACATRPRPRATLPLDFPRPDGEGPDPHDYFDTALGGCKALTLMWYAAQACRCNRSTWTWYATTAKRKGVYRLTARLTLHGDLTDTQRAELLAVAENAPSTA